MAQKVTDYMTAKVVSITADTGVREAFFLMKEKSIRHLPIVNEDGKLIGIISDRELRRPNWVDESHDIAHVYYLDDTMLVQDVMIKRVHVLHTYDTLWKAVNLLLEHHIGAAPVLDKNDDLVGMLSTIDVMQAFADTIAQQKQK